MIRVSICVPAYNNADCVKRLLDSIAVQTFQDYEVIITDDSDQEEIEALVKQYKDDRIRYVHNPKKLGHIFNWNQAISLAAGEYIKIMFSDDWFTYADSLSKYVALLDNEGEADFAFSGSMQVSDENADARDIPEDFVKLLKQDYRHIFLGNQVGAPSGTIYRNKGYQFDEKSNWASDLVLYLEILSHNSRFACSKRPLVSIGLHGEQYTNMFQKRDMRIFNDYAYMYRKFYLAQNAACKEFFLKQYVMLFGVGLKTARENGYTVKEYLKVRIPYLWQNKVVDYVKAGMKKLTGIKSKS